MKLRRGRTRWKRRSARLANGEERRWMRGSEGYAGVTGRRRETGKCEFVTTKEARRRLHAYDKLESTTKVSPALLVVREHLPSGKACLRVNIDATNIGNVARFINHSCDGGNLMAVLVRNSGSFLPRLCFFAALDISEGEELTFSYGDARLRRKDSPCFCGKEACLRFLPSEET
ncbi:Histone-lysine N-methyltransferase SUVR3 [Platanthera guangdongensis]|uniref:Histone-lysine N-methyltransferase SUVR3 n=1 Tax=Platanthera guangdongensis TaxID=2320717 RepID=A0ABR2MB12_9ASPA